MRNKYSILFKDYDKEKWKEVRDKYQDIESFRNYINEDIPLTTLRYYDDKFNYTPIPSKYRKEIGKIYGHLTIIDFDGIDTSRNIRWKCKCSCGNIVTRAGSELRRTRTKDHMCEQCIQKATSKRFFNDLTGQTINQLEVLERVGSSKQGNSIYKCKCLNCGNIINVNSSRLNKSNPQISCGCINSAGEYLINILLNELQIPYQTQYQFSDCIYVKPLRFDFAIFNSNNELLGLIEFQGKQHYTLEDIPWDNYDFETAQKRDNIKREYCKSHNISLIEIPYTDYKKLNKEYLLNIINGFKG